MLDVCFLPATELDVETIVALRKTIWSTTYRGIYPEDMIDHFDFDWHRKKEEQRMRNSEYSSWIIATEGRNVGYLTVRETHALQLQSLYLLKDFQRKGIGAAAMNFVKQRCFRRGRKTFFCSCVPLNQNARRFYEKMGGRVICEDCSDAECWKHSVTYEFQGGDG